ncbi:MAG: hypothetical protein IJ637_02165 [Prevotella sp.]|nr:hypothetical protein [Prevotella sp.]
MSNNDRIRTLTERYFLGETTLDEERQLYRLYRQQANVPGDLQAYRQMFLDMEAICYEPAARVSLTGNRRARRWLIAATLALAMGISAILLFQRQAEDECVAYIYGQKTTDRSVVMAEMLLSAEAMTIGTEQNEVETQLNEMFTMQ